MPTEKIVRLALLAALVAGAAISARAEVLEQIVAQVNGEIITLSEYTREKNMVYQMMRSQFTGQELTRRYAEALGQILPNMINEILLLEKAKEYGFSTDLDLEARQFVEDMMKRERIPNLEALKQEMSKQGITYSQYFEGLKKQILLNRMRGAIVRQRVKVMKDELEKYYKEHANEFALPAKVELQEIVIYSKDKTRDQLKAKAAEVETRLKGGEAFEEVAKALSEGPTAAQGGKIGSFATNALSATIGKAITGLGPGQTAGPLETDYGMVVVRVTALTPSQLKPFDEVKDQIEDDIFRVKVGPVIETYVKELREDAYINVSPEFRADYNPETQVKPLEGETR
ncbi:MAG: peptidyl-prolyl cis-trans isomerase [Acidobacteria bacterium]|nr:peptidyl-prolyl cis-trans isomerase [Acidobacteriota bacterium]